jgi:hypothetical protein
MTRTMLPVVPGFHGRPDFIPDLPRPARTPGLRVRHRLKRWANTIVDSGRFGFTPLHTHVVVCGYPRSGTTLLQLMIENCVADIRKFGREYEAIVAASYALRNNRYMFTKDPDDIFYLDQIREHYSMRRAIVRFVVTMRDPRAVLVSIQNSRPTAQAGGYWIEPRRWDFYHAHVRNALRSEDVLAVEYKDLICQPSSVQRDLAQFIGWDVKLPFEQFHTVPRRNFDEIPLNGVRPLDSTRLDAWSSPSHRPRIQQLLQEIPRLPDYLVEMGYETDTTWIRDYEGSRRHPCGPIVPPQSPQITGHPIAPNGVRGH